MPQYINLEDRFKGEIEGVQEWIIEKSSFYPTYGVEVPTYSLCWRNISNGAAVKIKIEQR